jgi:pyrimidine-specific ribonucleoside hydrolase
MVSMKRTRSIQENFIIICLFAGLLIFNGCQIAPSAPTPTSLQPTVQTTTLSSTATTKVEPVKPAPFALEGSWLGGVKNGDTIIPVTIDIKGDCEIGQVCANFNLMSIPCSGTYTLMNMVDNVYEFKAGDFNGICGIGKDYLTLMEDGTLRYTSIGDYGEIKGYLFRVMPVLYDDDGSPDGTVALMYLLSDPRVSVKAITISYGESYPKTYIQYIGGLLESFGITNIPMGAGQSSPIAGNNSFPESIRQGANAFWGMPLPNLGKIYPVTDAAALIVSTLNAAPEPYNIFISGPCTNLAAALRLDPGIKKHIKSVYIMGGAFFIHGNLDDLLENPPNNLAEWNIFGDPQAATEVFSSGLDINLIPLDATNQVKIGTEDTTIWRKGGQQAIFAADLYDSLLKDAPGGKMAIWDIMTAEIMVLNYLCEFKDLDIEVVTAEGKQNGQTEVNQSGTPNMHVCLDPIPGEIIRVLDDVFFGTR